jgi:hypothetical protein
MSSKFPDINGINLDAKEFTRDIILYYKGRNDYSPLKAQPGEKNRCIGDNSKVKKLSIAQRFIYDYYLAIMQDDKMWNNFRGMLLWHSTGSGKTLASAALMEASLTGKRANSIRRVLYVSSRDGLNSNPPSDFLMKYIKPFLPGFYKNLIDRKYNNKEWRKGKSSELLQDNNEIDPILINKNDKESEKILNANGIEFMTFAQLSHALGLVQARKNATPNFLQNCVLIMDEIHNIFKPLPNQAREHTALKNFLSNRGENHRGLKIFILSATPGDDITSIIELMNMIRWDDRPPITAAPLDKLRYDTRGMISYLDMSWDLTKFPKLDILPPHHAFMNDIEFEKLIQLGKNKTLDQEIASRNQFLKYLDIVKESEENPDDYNTLARNNQLNKYYRQLRKYSNGLYSDSYGMDYSAKIPVLMREIQKYPKQKQYIYSAFYEKGSGKTESHQGIYGIKKLLDSLGYVEFDTKFADMINHETWEANDTSPYKGLEIEKKKRYMIIGITDPATLANPPPRQQQFGGELDEAINAINASAQSLQSAISAPSPAISAPNTAISAPNLAPPTQSPAISALNTAISAPNTAISAPNLAPPTQSPAISAPNTAISAPNPAPPTQSPAIPTPNTAISAQSPAISTQSPTRSTPARSAPASELDNQIQIERREKEYVTKLMKYFNSDMNANGEYIQILLASKNYNESIDIKAVRHIHIYEPFVSWISRKQAIGRAVRNCSHSQLPVKDWTVTLHEYFSDRPWLLTQYSEDFIRSQIEIISKSIISRENEIDTYQKQVQNDPNNAEFYRQRINKHTRDNNLLKRRLDAYNNMLKFKTVEMIDEKLYSLSQEKYKQLEELEKTLINNAIDNGLYDVK